MERTGRVPNFSIRVDRPPGLKALGFSVAMKCNFGHIPIGRTETLSLSDGSLYNLENAATLVRGKLKL